MNTKFSIETISSRHSVRSYTELPISAEHKAVLTDIIEQCNKESGLHMQLVTDEPNAYGRSFFAHYGNFKNVRNYVCLVGRKADDTEEKLGYYGEIVVLKAQEIGLNTCWCGLSYSKSNTHCRVNDGEKIYALIAIGYGRNQGVERNCKPINKFADENNLSVEWFRKGVECAMLAPTAMNQQKFKFAIIEGHKVKASTSWGFYCKMDLGIARLHFELGAGVPIEWTK